MESPLLQAGVQAAKAERLALAVKKEEGGDAAKTDPSPVSRTCFLLQHFSSRGSCGST